MTTIICLTILAYWISGKEIQPLLNRMKNVDWKQLGRDLMATLRPYAIKTGRAMARYLLQIYFVMTDERTSTLDRVLIYAALTYTIMPFSLVPSAVYRILGVLDEGAALLFVHRKIQKFITPEIEYKVNQTLDEWFVSEHEIIHLV